MVEDRITRQEPQGGDSFPCLIEWLEGQEASRKGEDYQL